MSWDKPINTPWARRMALRSLTSQLDMLWLCTMSNYLARGLWKLGRIQELLEGCDGHYRDAIVKTVTSDGRPELLRRPNQRLYPLEMKGSSDSYETTSENASRLEVVSPREKPPIDDVGEDRSTEGAVTPAEPQSRPRRTAAQQGEERRKACMIELDEDWTFRLILYLW